MTKTINWIKDNPVKAGAAAVVALVLITLVYRLANDIPLVG
jgi:hypothetical protein